MLTVNKSFDIPPSITPYASPCQLWLDPHFSIMWINVITKRSINCGCLGFSYGRGGIHHSKSARRSSWRNKRSRFSWIKDLGWDKEEEKQQEEEKEEELQKVLVQSRLSPLECWDWLQWSWCRLSSLWQRADGPTLGGGGTAEAFMKPAEVTCSYWSQEENFASWLQAFATSEVCNVC